MPTSKKRRRRHDPAYRRVFNRARIIEEILHRFVGASWVDQLDFSTLEPVPADFVTLRLDPRESDIIWRVRYGDDEDDWFFVFVLMELQSTVPRFMALRLWGYVHHIAEAILRDNRYLAARRPRLLPPILAVVLYNGEKPWTAPLSLAELFKPMEGYDPPDFRYVVLDVNRYPPEQLRPVETVTGGIFLMEQAGDVGELQAVAEELEGLVDDPELEEDLALLLSDVAIQLDLKDEEAPSLRSLREVKMSLLQRAEKWTQEWMAEGRAEGRVEGRAEGQRLGKAGALKDLASHRFGELPEAVVERVDRADVDTLDRWFRRCLDATRLDDVFDPE